MNVTATRVGFYGKLRKPGDQFDVRDDAFSSKWMKRVEESAAEPAEPENAAETVATTALSEPAEHPSVEPVVKKRRGRKPKAVSE